MGEFAIAPSKIHCPSCKVEIFLLTGDQAQTCCCKNCKKALRRDEDIFKGGKTFEHFYKPFIEVGRSGKIEGIMYTCVGFLVRREAGTQYQWREYFLFDPATGYRTLSEFNGHWNLFKPAESIPVFAGRPYSFNYKELTYTLYNSYKAVTDYAEGEFSWNILETRSCVEYINAPFIYSRELTNDRQDFFLGVYTEVSEIIKWFEIKESPPARVGIGATQPFRFSFDFDLMKSVTTWTVLLLLFLQIYFTFSAKEERVFSERFEFIENDKPISSRKFIIGSPAKGNLEFMIYAPINNNWFYANIVLVNDDNGETYEISKELSMYSGYDEGYAWSEGAQNETLILNNIPPGLYHLNIFPSGGLGIFNFHIDITRDVPVYFNFLMTVILIICVPILFYYKQVSFEKRRWMNSDYSPFENEE